MRKAIHCLSLSTFKADAKLSRELDKTCLGRQSGLLNIDIAHVQFGVCQARIGFEHFVFVVRS